MKDEPTPPCWREAKAWAEEQESGDSVAAWLLALFVVAIAAATVVTTVRAPAERDRKAQYLLDHQCYTVGFYGRSGDYKVYNCMGRLVKEDDL